MSDPNPSRNRAFSPEQDRQDLQKLKAIRLAEQLNNEPGPNKWDEMTPADFAPKAKYDYIVEGHGSITVIDPVGVAALQWLYAHLPEDCPRWGKFGFAIETNFVGDVLEGMGRDGLMSSAEFDEAMAANERDSYAGEGS